MSTCEQVPMVCIPGQLPLLCSICGVCEMGGLVGQAQVPKLSPQCWCWWLSHHASACMFVGLRSSLSHSVFICADSAVCRGGV